MTIHRILDPAGRRDRAFQMLERVGFSEEHYYRFRTSSPRPAATDRDRAGIDRLPELIICDEPVSALDVRFRRRSSTCCASCSGNSADLLLHLHDLSVIRHISDRVGVMYLGELSRKHRRAAVRRAEATVYQALLSAVRSRGPGRRERIVLSGEVPSAANPPAAARSTPAVYSRCPVHHEAPARRTVSDGHVVACHLYEGAVA